MSSRTVLRIHDEVGISRQMPGKAHFRSRQQPGWAKEKKRKGEKRKRVAIRASGGISVQVRPLSKIFTASVLLLLVFMGDEDSSVEIFMIKAEFRSPWRCSYRYCRNLEVWQKASPPLQVVRSEIKRAFEAPSQLEVPKAKTGIDAYQDPDSFSPAPLLLWCFFWFPFFFFFLSFLFFFPFSFFLLPCFSPSQPLSGWMDEKFGQYGRVKPTCGMGKRGERGSVIVGRCRAVSYFSSTLYLQHSIRLSTEGMSMMGKLYEHCTLLGMACAGVGLCAADGMNLYDYRTML